MENKNDEKIVCTKCKKEFPVNEIADKEKMICKSCANKKKWRIFLLLFLLVVAIVAVYFLLIKSDDKADLKGFDGVNITDTSAVNQKEMEVEGIDKIGVAKRLDNIGGSVTDLEDFKRMLESTNEISAIGILFDKNSPELTTERVSIIDFFIEQYKKLDSGYSILIEGYTCDLGTDMHNKNLSQNRAIIVKDYLVQKGIQENNIKYESFGESKFKVTNDIDQDRTENRRVNVSIVDK